MRLVQLTVQEDAGSLQRDLLLRVATGLLQPKMPLSAAASNSSTLYQASGSVTSVVKTLPVELLYDAAGLDLFDQVGKRFICFWLSSSASCMWCLCSAVRPRLSQCTQRRCAVLEHDTGTLASFTGMPQSQAITWCKVCHALVGTRCCRTPPSPPTQPAI